MNVRVSLFCLAAIAGQLTAPASAAPLTQVFASTHAQRANGDLHDFQFINNGTGLVSVTAISELSVPGVANAFGTATAIADFGVLKGYAETSGQKISENFRGTGVATATFDDTLSIQPQGGATPTSTMVRFSFVLETGIELNGIDTELLCSRTVPFEFRPRARLDITIDGRPFLIYNDVCDPATDGFTVELAIAAGRPFNFGGRLEVASESQSIDDRYGADLASTANSAKIDALHSAYFAIELLDPTFSIFAESGTTYLTALPAPASVPEPMSLGLFCASIGGLLAARRRVQVTCRCRGEPEGQDVGA